MQRDETNNKNLLKEKRRTSLDTSDLLIEKRACSQESSLVPNRHLTHAKYLHSDLGNSRVWAAVTRAGSRGH
jgi:hypothetical protein